MTLISTSSPAVDGQVSPIVDRADHLILYDVQWSFYEALLEQIGDGALRVTYDDGTLEIMAPLQRHEVRKGFIGRMVNTLSEELDIPVAGYGSTTFRRRDKKKGLEPDECFFIQNEAKVRDVSGWDPKMLSPDLAIEIDVTSRSVPRMPVYAALGVREVWRHDGKILTAFELRGGEYARVEMSVAFPFLRVTDLNQFIQRMQVEGQFVAIKAFREWVRTVGRSPR